MSWWTHINGLILVKPAGRTQPEKRYILETVLDHLPKVSGSEKNMKIHIVQKAGYSGSANFNEFFETVRQGDFIEIQDSYYLILEGDFRDRMYEQTFRELNKFLNRLAKRIYVDDILIRLTGWDKETIISNPDPYQDMYEYSANSSEDEPAWWEYLFWDRDLSGGDYPEKLTRKYPKLKGRNAD